MKVKYSLLRDNHDEKAALAFLESKAREADNDDVRRLLVDAYYAQKDFDASERILRSLIKKDPKDSADAVSLVRLAWLRALDASGRNDDAQRRAFEDKTTALVREFRAQFPADLTFLQMECDLAARRGDMTRAAAITQEMDKIARNSTAGPLARARLYAAQGRTREMADAYSEAIERSPKQLDVHLLLGQARLKLGETDEALRQARYVLDVIQRTARMRSLAPGKGALADQPRSREPGGRTSRHRRLPSSARGGSRSSPGSLQAHHLIAGIEMKAGHRDKAVAALKAGLKANPEDGDGLISLIELLTGPRGRRPASPPPAESRRRRRRSPSPSANATRRGT